MISKLRQIVVCLALVAVAGTATAARFHVSLDGARTTGPSTPGDWTAGNCYAGLAGAAAAASAADTLLLSREAHVLDTQASLGAFLGNRDLDQDPAGCQLTLLGVGELIVDPTSVAAEVAGLDLRGDGTLRGQSAMVVINTTGELASLSIRGSRFTGFNGGRVGGGSALHAASGNGAALSIDNCVFTGNESLQRGGAIRIGDGFLVVIEESVFDANRTMSGGSVPYGGAIGVVSTVDPTHLTIRRCSFTDNASAQIGGAISVHDASLVLEDTEVVGSRSAHDGVSSWAAGAGVMVRRNEGTHAAPVELVIRRSYFADNMGNLAAGTGAGDGGAVMVRGSLGRDIEVTVEHSDFIENYNDQGAGLYIGRFTNGTVDYCRFHRNRTTHNGGATFKGGGLPENLGETAVYRFCEFIDNAAGVDAAGNPVWAWARGGAFSTRERPRAEFYHCTFVNNVVHGASPMGDAIGLYADGGTFDDDLERCVMVNCVFWGDGNDVQVRSQALGFSLVSNCAWPAGQFVVSGVTPVDAVILDTVPFVSLAVPVPMETSSLVDAGFDLGLSPDLLGTSMPQGAAPDIGAYEVLRSVGVLPHLASGWLQLDAYPNPFNPTTVITCDLPAAGEVTLEVLDLRGRRVVALHGGWLDAGSHRWQWGGRDHRDEPVAAGVYLARLTGREGQAMRKLMLVK